MSGHYYKNDINEVFWLSDEDKEALVSGKCQAIDIEKLIPITEEEAIVLRAQPLPTVTNIKEEARRRIHETGLSWYVEREVSGGSPIPEAIKAYCAEVRSASNDLEALDPIPTDYADDNYWPERIIVSEEN